MRIEDRRDLHAFEEQLSGQYATAAELEDREDRHRRRDFTSFFPTRDGMREASGRRATRKLQQGVQRKAGNYVLAPIASLRHLSRTKEQ